MAEDNKNIVNETDSNGGKKKKIIIAVVIVAVVAAVAAAVMLFGNKSNNKPENTSDNVSASETSELAPGIENGVLDERGEQNTNQNSDSSGNSSSNNTASSENNSSAEQDNSGSGSDLTATEPAAVPKNRQLEISVIMPNDGNAEDILEIIINGESIGTVDKINNEPLKTNGKTFTFKTVGKYEGDVVVEAKLQNYYSSASVTVREGYDKVSIALPLDGVEENFAPDL